MDGYNFWIYLTFVIILEFPVDFFLNVLMNDFVNYKFNSARPFAQELMNALELLKI